MGIRINKGIGWVLTGKNLDIEKVSNITLQNLKDEFKTNNPRTYEIDFDFPEIDLSKPLNHFILRAFSECEPTPVLLFIPPFMRKKWHRYDDGIDFYTKKDLLDHVEYIKGDLYPCYEKFVISSNLNFIEDLDRQKASMLSDCGHILEGSERERLIQLGFDLAKPLNEQMHMTAPLSLKLMLSKLDPSVDYRGLRPAVVTWWS